MYPADHYIATPNSHGLLGFKAIQGTSDVRGYVFYQNVTLRQIPFSSFSPSITSRSIRCYLLTLPDRVGPGHR